MDVFVYVYVSIHGGINNNSCETHIIISSTAFSCCNGLFHGMHVAYLQYACWKM